MITITCSDGKKRRYGLRAQYAHLKSERAVRIVITRTIQGFRDRGQPEYADALERKSILEQMSLLGMISNGGKLA